MFQHMKLGRIRRPIPAGVPDLRAHAIFRATAPTKLDRSMIDFRPQMFGNDTLGDCTCVLVGNTVLGQAALYGYQAPIVTADVVQLYREACGYNPADPSTDRGGFETDVLTYQARQGFFPAAQQVPYTGLWANLERGDLNLLRLATARLGVGYLAVNLALADQADGTWDTDIPASAGDPTPGSWGGHALGLWSYDGIEDTDVVNLVTWGSCTRRATWRWVKSRMDEAHALFHPQMMPPAGMTAAGIDRDTLIADVDSFGGP